MTLLQTVTICAGYLAYPWDTVRRRMMMQAGRTDKLYASSWDCVVKIVCNEGLGGLYKVRALARSPWL